MEQPSIHQLFAPKGEFLEPPQSSKSITPSSYEFCPSFIAMVRKQTFSGFDYENPYHHLREFEQLYACLTILGMSQYTLWWKLFPFSLDERAKQWYAHNVGKVAGDWEELRNKFCLILPYIPNCCPMTGNPQLPTKRDGNHMSSLGLIFNPNSFWPRLVYTQPYVVATFFVWA
jgi:hypothetical protein